MPRNHYQHPSNKYHYWILTLFHTRRNQFFLKKWPVFLEEMKPGKRNVHDESETSCHTQKQESNQRLLGCSKRTQKLTWRDSHTSQRWAFEISRRIIVVIWSQWFNLLQNTSNIFKSMSSWWRGKKITLIAYLSRMIKNQFIFLKTSKYRERKNQVLILPFHTNMFFSFKTKCKKKKFKLSISNIVKFHTWTKIYIYQTKVLGLAILILFQPSKI